MTSLQDASHSKRKNVETENEESNIAHPPRKRVRIAQDHDKESSKESSNRPHDMDAPIEAILTINSLISERRSLNTPSKDEDALLGSPCSADYGCDPSIVEGAVGSDDSDGISTPPMLTLPPPGTEGPNQRQVVDQAFPENTRYMLNTNPDIWDRGQPSYALEPSDTFYYSDDDEYEYGVVLSSPEIGGEGSLALTLNQTRNAITNAYK